MARKRRKFNPKFKASVALEAIREQDRKGARLLFSAVEACYTAFHVSTTSC